jgi:hypothetical protein
MMTQQPKIIENAVPEDGYFCNPGDFGKLHGAIKILKTA